MPSYLTDILKTAVAAISSIVVLFLLTKALGCKQMSQLSMFDYINGITIGSIAAEMATEIEGGSLKPLTAMIIYAASVMLINKLSNHSVRFRKFAEGEVVYLIHNGKLNQAGFKKTRLDLSEFLTQCRSQGYFDLSEIDTVLLEPNGKLSILAKPEFRNMQPSDAEIVPDRTGVSINLIMDGRIIDQNLKKAGKDINWLKKELKRQNIGQISDVFLAVVDEADSFTAFRKS